VLIEEEARSFTCAHCTLPFSFATSAVSGARTVRLRARRVMRSPPSPAPHVRCARHWPESARQASSRPGGAADWLRPTRGARPARRGRKAARGSLASPHGNTGTGRDACVLPARRIGTGECRRQLRPGPLAAVRRGTPHAWRSACARRGDA
jgi:hypothetical protein